MKKKLRVTKSLLNGIENAGTMALEIGSGTEMTDTDLKNTQWIGEMLIKYEIEILKLIIEKEKSI